MPQTGAVRTKELHNLAEHAHDKGAHSHAQADHLTAHEQTKQEAERSREAQQHAETLKDDTPKE